MKKHIKTTKKIFRSDPHLILRIGVVFATLITLISVTIISNFADPSFAISNNKAVDITMITSDDPGLNVPAPDYATASAAAETLEVEIQKQIEEELRQQQREADIQRVLAFLTRKGSVVANYEIAALIVDGAQANGADYRVILAIMGVESGFCNASFWNNCFGYLNGVHYSSYYSAFQDLVPKVARQYAAPYGWNFAGLAQAYGMNNWQYHSANMQKWASEV